MTTRLRKKQRTNREYTQEEVKKHRDEIIHHVQQIRALQFKILHLIRKPGFTEKALNNLKAFFSNLADKIVLEEFFEAINDNIDKALKDIETQKIERKLLPDEVPLQADLLTEKKEEPNGKEAA